MSDRKQELIKQLEEAMTYDSSFDELAPRVREIRSEFVELVRKDHDALREEEEKKGNTDFKPPHDDLGRAIQ